MYLNLRDVMTVVGNSQSRFLAFHLFSCSRALPAVPAVLVFLWGINFLLPECLLIICLVQVNWWTFVCFYLTKNVLFTFRIFFKKSIVIKHRLIKSSKSNRWFHSVFCRKHLCDVNCQFNPLTWHTHTLRVPLPSHFLPLPREKDSLAVMVSSLCIFV